MWILSKNAELANYALGLFDDSETAFRRFKYYFVNDENTVRVVSWADSMVELVVTTEMAPGHFYETSYILELFDMNELRYR